MAMPVYGNSVDGKFKAETQKELDQRMLAYAKDPECPEKRLKGRQHLLSIKEKDHRDRLKDLIKEDSIAMWNADPEQCIKILRKEGFAYADDMGKEEFVWTHWANWQSHCLVPDWGPVWHIHLSVTSY